jgi:ABC-type dipeptide/oligopeptide/nickel transport system ATPase component
VERVADRVAVLFRGDLVETASTEEFFRNPQHPYSQTLLESL